MSKLGAMSNRKSCKIDRIVWEMRATVCHVLCFPFVSVYTRTNCPFIVPKSSETKHHAEFQNSDAILEHLFFDIASNKITLRTFLPDNHNN